MQKVIVVTLALFTYTVVVKAQDDLLSALESQTDKPTKEFAEAAFKGSRLINGHTVVTRKSKSLEFLIAHRFGKVNQGAYDFFGIDGANVRFGLEYGIGNRLTAGIGRNSFEKTYDSFLKYALLRQQKGLAMIPVSVTWLSSIAIKTLKPSDEPQVLKTPFSQAAYSHVLLVAHKLSPAISLQVMPALIHRNEVEEGEKNDQYAIGVGGRVKVSKRISINTEYYHRVGEAENNPYQNSIAIGVDIETGGHVFQLHLTNSQSMIEKGFITETKGNFFKGDIHFGFNITRVFN
jgi:Membrane bound beta barrel domain (DUF5777)